MLVCIPKIIILLAAINHDDENNNNATQPEVVIEYIEDDGASAGCSRETGIKRAATTNEKSSKKRACTREDAYLKYLYKIEENEKEDAEKNREFMKQMFKEQQKAMIECTKTFLEGLRDMFSSTGSSKKCEASADEMD